jgi:hypothetical protein
MKHFKFTLPDELVRTMNRQQYKAAMQMDWGKVEKSIADALLYGTGVYMI